jgi:hypothetical protein
MPTGRFLHVDLPPMAVTPDMRLPDRPDVSEVRQRFDWQRKFLRLPIAVGAVYEGVNKLNGCKNFTLPS